MLSLTDCASHSGRTAGNGTVTLGQARLAKCRARCPNSRSGSPTVPPSATEGGPRVLASPVKETKFRAARSYREHRLVADQVLSVRSELHQHTEAVSGQGGLAARNHRRRATRYYSKSHVSCGHNPVIIIIYIPCDKRFLIIVQ